MCVVVCVWCVCVCVCVCVCECVWCVCVHVFVVCVCMLCMCCVCVCVVRVVCACVLIPLEVSFPNKVQLPVSVILCPLHSPFQGQAGMLPMEDMEEGGEKKKSSRGRRGAE